MTFFSLRNNLLCAALLAVICSAQALELNDPLPINPALKVGKLANGLTYYIQKNGKPEHRAELRLVVKAGSILEDDDQQGLAHFTEHMAFNGSQHFKKHELISYLQSIGIKFGADLNAYTGFDETVYILPIPLEAKPSGKSNLDTGLTVLEDWAQGLTLTDANIDAERHIILEEARLGKGASDRMNRALYPDLFGGSRYAIRLPIGKEDIISNFSHDAIRRFYADWYRPDLMAVFVVGDIDPQQVEQKIQEYFSHLKNPVPERPRDYAVIPARSSSVALVITDKEATNNSLMIRYPAQPSHEQTTIADYRNELIKILGSTILNQRLQDLTEQATPPFLAGGSGMESLAHGYESYSDFALIGRAGVQPAIDAVIRENERARQFGFSAAELKRTKKALLRNYESQYHERDKSDSASFVAEYIRNFLTGETIPGIANEYGYVLALLPGITLDEVNQYAKAHIPDGSPKLIAYMGSDRHGETIPDRASLLAAVSSAEKSSVGAATEVAVASSLMAHPPAAGSIVSEQQNKKLGLTELTLSNGIKVILKPTDFKSDQVLLSATRFGGQSLFEDKDMFNARYAVPAEYSMGLANFPPSELEKILSGKTVSFQSTLGNYTESFSGAAASADLETLFQSVYLRLSPPRQDDGLFTAYISRMQDLSKNSMARPEALYSNTLITTLYNNHPRLTLAPQPKDFDQISSDRTAAIYRQRFNSAKGLTFILVGSFKVADIKPLIATYLASLPTTDLPLNYRDLQIRPVTGVIKKEVHAGTEEKSQVSIIFSGAAKYSKPENMRFQALVEIMNIRIIDVLREKLMLIYGGNVSGTLDRIPYQNYRFALSLPCGPENVDKVVAAAQGEINRIRQEGPTVEELNKVKKNWITNNDIALRSNEHWLSYLQDATLYQTDPADILTLNQRIGSLTTDEIKQTAQRYLNTNNYVQLVLYPEKK